MQIVPMRDLKDTVKIENLCAATQSPVFVTKNGYGKLVVMDMECFEKLMSRTGEAKLVNEGIADLRAGKAVCGKAGLDEMRQKYGFSKTGKTPDPDVIHPIPGYDKEIYVKPTIKNPNITVGDFTYIADSEFESHVTHLYEWNGDRLIIGKYCQIASGVEFVMNGANHQMNAVSTFPFYTLEGWDMEPPKKADLPLKGDTVIGNDVWIGQNAVILPGVRIGDGAIIGANSVVGSDVAPYTIVAGNPARVLRQRFDDELIDLLLRFRWWDRSVEEVNELIPVLTNSDLDAVRKELKERL